MFRLISKEQPKWYNLRWKLSNFLVRVARKIYPENPEVTAFYIQLVHDDLIAGRAIVRLIHQIYYPNCRRNENDKRTDRET